MAVTHQHGPFVCWAQLFPLAKRQAWLALYAPHTSCLDGKEVNIEVSGRHDPCVGIMAVPIAEAMVSLVLVDHLLINRAQCAEIKQELPFSE